MRTIAEVSQAMQQILTTEATELVQKTGFIQRQRKVTGANFSQTLVLGWLKNPDATLDELCLMGKAVGLSITSEGLNQRFTPEACAFMQHLLNATLQHVVRAQPVAIPLLERFNGVYLYDSSIVTLPDALREEWSGSGGVNTSRAALKMQVRWDMLTGTLDGPWLFRGRDHDRVAMQAHDPLPPGALRVADLGFWQLADFQQQSDRGCWWLSRLQAQTKIIDATGEAQEAADFLRGVEADVIDCDVRLGVNDQVPARLIAVRVPQEVADQRRRKLREDARRRGRTVSRRRLALAEWTVIVTNVPRSHLSVEEALVLLRLRWQIELLFKLWKSHGGVTRWRSKNHWRILCELYAKLIAMVIQHWCLILGTWRFPDRSLVKAAGVVRDIALTIALTLSSYSRLQDTLADLVHLLEGVAPKNKSRSRPRTFQLLLDVAAPLFA